MAIEHRDELAALMRLGPGHDVETAHERFLAYFSQRPPWMAQAACAGRGDEVSYFPGLGEDVRPAKALCSTCPVQAECLEYALEMEGGCTGIWGGTSDNLRRKMRRERHQAA